MKKKFLFILMLASYSMGYSQQRAGLNNYGTNSSEAAAPSAVFACNDGCISGGNITLGSTVTFTSNPTAQCTSCYDWDINNNSSSSDNNTVGNLKIVGSDLGKTVQIQGVSVGSFTVSLTYFDESGCHTCCYTGSVTARPPNCCAPKLTGLWQCRGGNTTGGTLTITSDSNCPVDWSKIQQVNISLNGSVFDDTYSSTRTINGPLTGAINNLAIVDSNIPECFNGNATTATVTFIYNNGCANVVKKLTLVDNATPPPSPLSKSETKISVSPNPTNSVVKFGGEDLNKFTVSISDNQGTVLISNQVIDKDIDVSTFHKGTYFYVITGENGYIQRGTIIKE